MHIDRDIRLGLEIPLVDAPDEGHNRWHPGIAPMARIRTGEVVRADLRDGLDGQLLPTTVAADVERMDMNRGHPLTGPFYVEGAEPGDVLEVEILGIDTADFGASCIVPGFGLLADRFSQPFVVRWTIAGGVARSQDLPGVAIPADPFIGLLGVSPSRERLAEFAEREAAIVRRGGFSLPPDEVSAVPAGGEPARDGLRTVPPRETGGNMDVKLARAGARVLLPVDVSGALLSLGDIHFAQGDGESCGVAIEIAGSVTFRCSLRRDGWRPRFPAIEHTEPASSGSRPCFATTGIPIAEDGENRAQDVYEAARNALQELIDWLVATRGLTREQAYVLVSVAADLRISSIVNVPNPVVAAVLPLDIFD